jgi:hypothetical protein
MQLLIKDRCLNILDKSLQILDCLTNYYIEVLGTQVWPSINDEHITLFMLKAYLSNEYFNINNLVNYLGIPAEDILLMGAKTLKTQTPMKKLLKFLNLLTSKM